MHDALYAYSADLCTTHDVHSACLHAHWYFHVLIADTKFAAGPRAVVGSAGALHQASTLRRVR